MKAVRISVFLFSKIPLRSLCHWIFSLKNISLNLLRRALLRSNNRNHDPPRWKSSSLAGWGAPIARPSQAEKPKNGPWPYEEINSEFVDIEATLHSLEHEDHYINLEIHKGKMTTLSTWIDRSPMNHPSQRSLLLVTPGPRDVSPDTDISLTSPNPNRIGLIKLPNCSESLDVDSGRNAVEGCSFEKRCLRNRR